MSGADEQIYSLLAQCAAAGLPITWLGGDVAAWTLVSLLRAQLAEHAHTAESEAVNDA